MPPGMLDKKTRRHVARNVGVASFTIESTKGGLAQPNPLSKLVLQPLKLFRASAQDRVDLLHLGIPASVVGDLADRMRVSRETLYDTLRLPRSSVIARIRAGEALPQEQAERVIGLAKLIGQVEALVEEAGDPAGFDAYRWMGQWMERTIPALGGKTPRSYMDSMTGQGIVSNLVEMIQSGAEA
jgi:putative toxin-antitoxin system antitoxin component (TIGR02293 family)